jgi:4-diphosphocytidyl-2C-methyl-D-erythritol kinase
MRGLGAVGVGMSGSGATVFGIFESEAESRSALARAGFEPPTWTCLTRLRGAPRDLREETDSKKKE